MGASGIYSVAQHSVLVSQHVPDADAMWGLLHDAHEAIVGDASSPLKVALRAIESRTGRVPGLDFDNVKSSWDELEETVANRVRRAFGLVGAMPATVATADLQAVVTERRDLLGDRQTRPWGIEAQPWPGQILPWPPRVAEQEFLDAFEKLGGRR